MINRFFLLIIIFSMASCQKSKTKNADGEIGVRNTDNRISIAYINDTESKVFAYLCTHILGNKEYVIDLVQMPVDSIYQKLAAKKIDLFLSARLPYTQRKLFNSNAQYINILGDSYARITSGLIVPAYVSINAITQLNSNAQKFDNTIYIVDNNVMAGRTDTAIISYQLRYKTKQVSIDQLDVIMKDAEKNGKWIVFSDCKPGIMWANYNLKYLRDPLKIFPDERFTILSKVGFKYDQPEIALFLSNFTIPENYFEEITLFLKENNDDLALIEEWYTDHKETVQSWFPDVWIDN